MAAASQPFGSAFFLVQRIQIVRAQVHGIAARTDDYNKKLDGLANLLQLVKKKPELQTEAVEGQVGEIWNIATKYIGVLTSENRDQQSVDDLCTRLDRASENLNTLILIAHIELHNTAQSSFTVHSTIIQRGDRHAHGIPGEGLSIATRLQGRSFSEGGGEIPLTDEDARAQNLGEKVSWIGNEAFDNSEILQTDLVERSDERLYKDNKAHRGSFVFQGKADGDSIESILRGRRAK